MKTTSLILSVSAATALVAGLAILVWFGFDGVWETDDHLVGSGTPALVSDAADVRGIANADAVTGKTTLRIDLSDDQFVGVGPADDVERYLAGTPYDEVTDIQGEPFTLDRERVDGDLTAAPPGEQSFWIAQGTSSLRWQLEDGNYRIVVMSADGSSPLLTTARFGIQLPNMPLFGEICVALGLALAALAGALALLARRSAAPPRALAA